MNRNEIFFVKNGIFLIIANMQSDNTVNQTLVFVFDNMAEYRTRLKNLHKYTSVSTIGFII